MPSLNAAVYLALLPSEHPPWGAPKCPSRAGLLRESSGYKQAVRTQVPGRAAQGLSADL